MLCVEPIGRAARLGARGIFGFHRGDRRPDLAFQVRCAGLDTVKLFARLDRQFGLARQFRHTLAFLGLTLAQFAKAVHGCGHARFACME